MSPDASTDEKISNQEHPEKRKDSIAASINLALGAGTIVSPGKQETASCEHSLNHLPTDSHQSIKSWSSAEERISKFAPQPSNSNLPHLEDIHHTTLTCDRKWVNDSSPNPSSQPLNRIDLAPNFFPNMTSGSPMLAPKARKEVAPDYTMT